jgi:adenylate kinase family enzyme
MKLFVFGNSGSGKSTLIDEVRKHFCAQVLAIDDFRKQYGNFKWEGEFAAKKKFVEAIDIGSKNQIIECSVIGRTGEMLRLKLSKITDSILIIILDTDTDLCIDRNKIKMWHELKMPNTEQNAIQKNIVKYKRQNISSLYINFKVQVLHNNTEQQQIANISVIQNLLSQ